MEKFEEAHEGGISLREAIEGITVAARIWHRLGGVAAPVQRRRGESNGQKGTTNIIKLFF